MSLVFLKNDDKTSQKSGRVQEPYRFSNYFTQPLKIPANSQVALINASFSLDQEISLDNDLPIYCCFGTPVLNQGFEVQLLDNKYIRDWTQFFNELGIEISQMNPDQNTNPIRIDQNVVQPPQSNVPPLNPESRTQQLTPIGGLNWFLKNSKKSGLTVTQQCDLMNDIFFQSFVPVIRPVGNQDLLLFANGATYGNFTEPTNAEAFPNTDDDEKTQASDNQLNHLALGNIAPYDQDPIVPRYFSPAPPKRLGTAMATAGQVTDWLNQPIENNFYNTQFSYDPTLENPLLQSTTSIATWAKSFPPPHLGNSRNFGWAVQANRTCIMRAVGSETPDIANNGYGSGHTHIGDKGSGGYVVMGLEVRPGQEADEIYDAGFMGSGDLEGCVGFAPFFAGVLPSAVLYDRENSNGEIMNEDDSVRDFLKNVDLNIGDDELPFGQNTAHASFDRNGAEARYLFGCKMGVVPQAGFKLGIQCQVLNPVEDGGSLEGSAYTNVNQFLNIPALCQGRNTACDPHYDFQPNWAINANPGPRRINTVGGQRSGVHLYLRFRWDTPYTMVCEFILADKDTPGSYNPATDEPYLPWDDPGNPAQNKDPLRGWCKLGQMKNPNNSNGSAGAQDFRYLLPTTFGDIVPVSYHNYTGAFTARKGYFAPQISGQSEEVSSKNNGSMRGFRTRSFWRQTIPGYDTGMMGHSNFQLKDNDETETSPPLVLAEIEDSTDLEPFDSTGRIQKRFSMLALACETDEDTEQWLYSNGLPRFTQGEPRGLAHALAWGLRDNLNAIEATIDFDINGGTDPYEILFYDGVNPYINSVEVISNHIQLLNLPIQSQQGVVNSQNKTIYNIPVFQGDDQKGISESTITNAYAFTPPQLIWIDLNNYQEMDLNKIDVLITDDNNEEQENLSHNTDITLIFRQKGAGDSGYLPINIPTEEPEIRKRIKKETKVNLIEL
tara:strand:- start:9314 stop:12151 length:2838 start_codon:yes stop_codon:yes gene_type:complete